MFCSELITLSNDKHCYIFNYVTLFRINSVIFYLYTFFKTSIRERAHESNERWRLSLSPLNCHQSLAALPKKDDVTTWRILPPLGPISGTVAEIRWRPLRVFLCSHWVVYTTLRSYLRSLGILRIDWTVFDYILMLGSIVKPHLNVTMQCHTNWNTWTTPKEHRRLDCVDWLLNHTWMLLWNVIRTGTLEPRLMSTGVFINLNLEFHCASVSWIGTHESRLSKQHLECFV